MSTTPGAFQRHASRYTKTMPVVVAKLSVVFHTAGKAKVTLKLTPAGKRLLKHSKRLKLTAKGTFTPTGGVPTTKKNAITLKH